MSRHGEKRFVLFLIGVAAALFGVGKGGAAEIVVRIDTQHVVAELTPSLWGTNFLFWIDNDAAVASGEAVERLKELSIGLLRFPGGTVAQNYDWRTNTLINPARWPQNGDGAVATDTDEFIAVCREVGAEPVLVVNTEAWVLKGDVAAGAREAAEWVRYCNSEKGYGVKYWEIGNENYYHISQNAEEYAACVNRYARAMKAVDPTIQVAVNGPWSTEMYGEGDLSPPAVRAILLDYEKRIETTKQTRLFDEAREALKRSPKEGAEEVSLAIVKVFDDYEKRIVRPEQRELLEEARAALANRREGEITWAKPWWETVVPICGGNVDLVTIHVYGPRTRIPGIVGQFEKIQQLFAQHHPKRSYGWFYSEFNQVDQELGEAARAIDNAELWLRLIEQGMNLACQWPFRWGKDRFAALVDKDTNRPRAHFFTLEVLSRQLGGALVGVTSSSKRLPAFASVDDGRVVVVLFGSRLDKSTAVRISTSDPIGTQVNARALIPESEGNELRSETVPAEVKLNEVSVTVFPGSLVWVELRLLAPGEGS